MSNEIDRLMALSPEELLGEGPTAIDEIIKYYRAQRAGGKAPKRGASASTPIDLVELGLAKKEAPLPRRKF